MVSMLLSPQHPQLFLITENICFNTLLILTLIYMEVGAATSHWTQCTGSTPTSDWARWLHWWENKNREAYVILECVAQFLEEGFSSMILYCSSVICFVQVSLKVPHDSIIVSFDLCWIEGHVEAFYFFLLNSCMFVLPSFTVRIDMQPDLRLFVPIGFCFHSCQLEGVPEVNFFFFNSS